MPQAATPVRFGGSLCRSTGCPDQGAWTGSKLVYLGGLPGAAGAEVRELSGLQMPTLTWDPATGHRAQLQGHGAVAISRAKVLTFG